MTETITNQTHAMFNAGCAGLHSAAHGRCCALQHRGRAFRLPPERREPQQGGMSTGKDGECKLQDLLPQRPKSSHTGQGPIGPDQQKRPTASEIRGGSHASHAKPHAIQTSAVCAAIPAKALRRIVSAVAAAVVPAVVGAHAKAATRARLSSERAGTQK